jgi:hypothetical protein
MMAMMSVIRRMALACRVPFLSVMCIFLFMPFFVQ